MVTVGDVGELGLIEQWLRPRFTTPDGWVGIGDDAALIPLGDGRYLAASTDRVPADFLALKHGAIDYRTLGRYLVALNVSDLAATGAEPLGLLLNMALPVSFAMNNVSELIDGVASGAASFGCPLVGGDTSDAAEVSLSATAFGVVAERAVLLRSGARPGDEVFVTRRVGAGAAILALLLEEGRRAHHPAWATWTREHFEGLAPQTRVARALARSGACTSCIDNTDGIAVSLHHLARASGVGIELRADRLTPDDVARVVLGDDLQGRLAALGPGVDLALVGTVDPDERQAAVSGLVHTIGVVTTGEGVICVDNGHIYPVDERGWEYFNR